VERIALGKIKIKGARGVWTAEVGGKNLAVLHNTLWNKSTGVYWAEIRPQDKGGARLHSLLEALRAFDEVVMQRDVSTDDFSRDGYIGVFRFTDLDIGEDHLSLRLTERVADPA